MRRRRTLARAASAAGAVLAAVLVAIVLAGAPAAADVAAQVDARRPGTTTLDARQVATDPAPGEPSAPGTGGGYGEETGPSGGIAVGIVLLVGAGLIAAAVALVGLRSHRDMVKTR